MVVLVPGERRAPALDGVGNEDGRAVAGRPLELRQQRLEAMAAEIAHEFGKLGIAAAADERGDLGLVAQFVEQALPPRGAAAEKQRRINAVGARVDPGFQALAARLGEGLTLQDAVFEGDHVPAEGAEDRLDAVVETLAHYAVEALAVVVNDPPGVAEAVLPALEQAFIDISLVQLRVADQRDHPPLEIDVVHVLGARGIGLRAAVGPEGLELVEGLVAEEILDGVKDRRSVRLDRDAVLGLQHGEVERGHDCRHRRRGGLMAADLHAAVVGADVVGVMDHPVGEPQRLAHQGCECAETLSAARALRPRS